MSEWIPIAVILSPLAIKLIQLRVLRVGGDGLIYMEFDSFFKVRSEKPPQKAIAKRLRKQVKH